jgi:hypothetical protein
MSKLVLTPSMIFVPFWGVFKLFLPYIAIIILIRIGFAFFKKELKKRKAENSKQSNG